MNDAFLSYSRTDSTFANRLRAALEERGKTVWIDKRDILPAEAWDTAAFSGIDSASNFLFVISPNAAAARADGTPSPCEREIGRAIESGKRLIPLHYKTTTHAVLPKEVRVLNDIDFRETDDSEEAFKAALDVLITAMNTDLAWMAQKSILQMRAQEWDSRGRENSRLLRGDELKKFEAWLGQAPSQPSPPTQLQSQYLLASRQAETRRQKLIQRIVAGVAMVLLVLAAFAVWQWIAAVRETRIATAGRLAATALNLKETKLDTAFLLSREAARLADTLDTRNAVLTLEETEPALLTYLHHGGAPDEFINSIAFRPDGARFAVGTDDGVIQIWDTQTRKPVWSHAIDGGIVDKLAYSPDGTRLAVLFDNGPLQVWQMNAGGGQPASRNLPEASKGGAGLAWNADGTLLATSEAGGIQAWKTENWQALPPVPLKGHGATIWSVAFSPADSGLLAAVDARGAIEVVDMRTGRSTGRATPPNAPSDEGFASLAFSGDGSMLAAGVWGGNVDVWRMRAAGGTTGLSLQQQFSLGDRGGVMDLGFSPDHTSLAAVSSHGAMRQWAIASGAVEIDAPSSLAGDLHALAFSPDGRTLITGLNSGTMMEWDETHSYAREFAMDVAMHGTGTAPEPIAKIAFSPDGRLMAAGGERGGVALWEVASGRRISQIAASDPVHINPVSTLVFARNGRSLFLAAQQPAGVRVWSVDHGSFVQPLPAAIGAVDIARDRSMLALAMQNAMELVDSRGKARQFPLALGSPAESQITVSGDGKYLAAITAGAPGFTRLWNVAGGAAKEIALEGSKHGGSGVVFNRAGTMLAGLGFTSDGISLWSTQMGKRIGTYVDPADASILGADFSPDGKFLALAIDGGVIRLLDLASLNLVGVPLENLDDETNTVAGVAYSPDGKMLAYGDNRGRVYLWDTDWQAWLQRGCAVANRNLSFTEWRRYLGNVPYHRTCPEFGDGEGVQLAGAKAD